MLFPAPNIDGGNSWITDDREYTVPGIGDLIIDDPSGVEHVFFLFSPSRINEVEDFVARGFVGTNVVEETILNLRNRQADKLTWKLEKERDRLREKTSIFSKQKDEFKRLYQVEEQKIKDLSEKQPVARKTVRLSKVLGN